MKVELKYLNQYKDRRGNLKIYYRRNRKLKGIELTARPVSGPDFMMQYAAAQMKQEAELSAETGIVLERSLNWLYAKYKQSDRWSAFAAVTKTNKQKRFEQYLDSVGHLNIDQLDAIGVERIRDKKRNLPSAANNRLKDLHALFNWAVQQKIIRHNPCAGVSKMPIKTKPDGSTGHRTWADTERQQFLEFYPLGTREYLAMMLLICTGARRSDVIYLGPRNVEDGLITFVQKKNRDKVDAAGQAHPKTIIIPMRPELAEAIEAYQEASTIVGLTWLATRSGKPFESPDSFGNWFRKICRAANMPAGLSPHGVRKAGAAMLAENGATEKELLAIFGWNDTATAQIYTEMADNKKLAIGGLAKLKVTTAKTAK